MKLQDWKRASAEAKKQGVGMQRKLALYWISMALAVFLCVLLVLVLSRGVPDTMKELEEAVLLQQKNNQSLLSGHADSLAAQCVALSETAGREIGSLLSREGLAFEELNDNPRALGELEAELCRTLGETMQFSRCSGAYVMLNVTTNTGAEQAADSRSGVYLRAVNLSALEKSKQSLTCFRGDPEVARAFSLPLHSRWEMEFSGSTVPGFEELMGKKLRRAADSCFWSGRLTLPGTWEKVLLLSAPVLDQNGTVCGLCGVELSELYFRLAYPGIESTFGRIVTMLAPVSEENILLDSAMLGGTEDTWLEPCGIMEKENGEYRIGKNAYYGVHEPLKVRISPAPGSENGLELVTLVPTEGARSGNVRARMLWIGIALGFLLLTAVLSVVFSRRFVRPILSSLEAIRNQKPLEESYSGIAEVDDLLAYISSKKQERESVPDGALPPHVEELLHQFSQKFSSLTPTERSIFRHIAAGHDLEETAGLSFISINTVKKHNTNINRKLGVSSREELLLYIDLFRRCGRLDEITGRLG